MYIYLVKYIMNPQKTYIKNLHAVGFDPTSVATSELESDPLDRSGTYANLSLYIIPLIRNKAYINIFIIIIILI